MGPPACAIGGATPSSASTSASRSPAADAVWLPPKPNQRAPGVPVDPPAAVLVPAASPAAVPVPAPAGANAPHVRTLKIPKRSAATAPTMACKTAAMPVITLVTTFATNDMTAPCTVRAGKQAVRGRHAFEAHDYAVLCVRC
ncbi:hypothetical protein GY45DRAFT_1322721 [Cubamyces sp. BRFM 1775]|nr:hypothetical protein GY45DRAFT_1322721 [Cubamyces sp. BRFM 1775]